MATILRDWSYRYQWLYDAIARVAALTVGGESRLRHLALQGLTINPDTQVLDLCCGSGQTTKFLVQYSQNVTGLDASPLSLKRARHNVPEATYVEAFAEEMPFSDEHFDLVHASVAMHEMQPDRLRQIFREVYRVLKPGGVFAMVDFHRPTNPVFWPGLAVFLWLFETETSWQLLATDLAMVLSELGFEACDYSKSDRSSPIEHGNANPSRTLYAGGSLQVIQAKK